MKPTSRQPSREDVLDAFAVEEDVGRETLERYLRAYPQYAPEIVDLARELSRVIIEDDQPLSAKDLALVDAAWTRHLEAVPKAVVDPLSGLSVAESRAIARNLEIPRQVVTAFRERKVIAASVPRRFLVRLAAAANTTVESIESAWALPPPSSARSYKADEKPTEAGAVTFEQLLIDAGVSEEKRALLLADDD